METNHADGGYYGPRLVGRNFRRLLEAHPPYVDPYSSLAGAYMANYNSYRATRWKPELSDSHLEPDRQRYQLVSAIGAQQHFCQDLAIGLREGWQGIADRVAYSGGCTRRQRRSTPVWTTSSAGWRAWIANHARTAAEMAP
jgi:hypothetical protein